MPMFMDVHNMDGGVSAADVAGVHQKDVETQGRYGVDYKHYWVDDHLVENQPVGRAATTVTRLAAPSPP